MFKMKKLLLISSFCFIIFSCNFTDAPQMKTAAAKRPPLEDLLVGNQAFVETLASDQNSYETFLKNQQGQHPQAVIITCSDSRIPPSLLFQKNIGDLFTIRTAGNMIGDMEMASIEYAVSHLHTPLILVMGHTHCGAISAFVHHENAPEHIKIIMDTLSNEKEIRTLLHNDKQPEEEAFVIANTLHTAKSIVKQSKLVRKQVEEGTLEVRAAIYHLETGKVEVLAQ